MTTELRLVCAETGESYAVEEGMVIGRNPEANIHIDSKTVSHTHAHIKREGEFFVIEDLNSTNGIQLGGRSISRVRLHHGQIFRLGERHLHIVDPNAPARENSGRDPHDNPSFDVIDDPGDEHTVFRGGYDLPPGWSQSDYESIEQQSKPDQTETMNNGEQDSEQGTEQ